MEKYSLKNTERNYNSDIAVKAYTAHARYGLWTSEKIVFKKYLKTDDCILDVGCGAGRTTLGLYKLGYKNIIGLDLSKRLIEEAKKLACETNDDIKYVVGNALNLQYKNSTFDKVIFSYNRLTCIPGRNNRLQAASEIYRVLKNGGMFIFTAPDRAESGKNAFWEEEKIRWEKGGQDARLNEFGDKCVDNSPEGGGFLHFADFHEIFTLACETGFKLYFTEMSSNVCKVPALEQKKFGESRFYVLKK